MIQKFVEAWDANKASLEEHLKTHRMEEYDEYDKLVKLLFEIVINPYISTQDETPYDVEKMTVIDDGINRVLGSMLSQISIMAHAVVATFSRASLNMKVDSRIASNLMS